MLIKYGEITIIRNTEQEAFLSYITRQLFNNEGRFTDNDTIIVLFDDQTIYDVNTYTNQTEKFIFTKSEYNFFPLWFDMNNNTMFYKDPTIKEEKQRLKFDICNPYRNQHHIEFEPSFYNIIYQKTNNDVFCIVRIKSTDDKPRFIVGYDDEIFNKNDVLYLVNSMLKGVYVK